MRSSTCFDPEGHLQEDCCVYRYRTRSMNVKHYTIAIYTTIFVKMNPRLQNM